jgi:hypothetical protein
VCVVYVFKLTHSHTPTHIHTGVGGGYWFDRKLRWGDITYYTTPKKGIGLRFRHGMCMSMCVCAVGSVRSVGVESVCTCVCVYSQYCTFLFHTHTLMHCIYKHPHTHTRTQASAQASLSTTTNTGS